MRRSGGKLRDRRISEFFRKGYAYIIDFLEEVSRLMYLLNLSRLVSLVNQIPTVARVRLKVATRRSASSRYSTRHRITPFKQLSRLY